MRDISIGEVLDGRYEILSLLGRGGMGSVYKARQLKLDRIVALKIPNAAMLADAGFMRRFEREARTCARFTHDHIVTIHDVMVSPDLAYICMEFVDGQALDDFLAAHARILSVADVTDLIGQICDGLHAAHRLGIVHRDIKPANICVTRDKHRAKIMDFGIARVSEATALTLDGSVLGTPQYMAPEQIRGEAVGPASDIYALTIVIYKIFTLRVVFDGELTQIIFKHVSEPPTPPRRFNRRLPGGFDDCLLKGLAKSPAERYQTTLELFDRLRDATAPIAHLPLADVAPPPPPMPLPSTPGVPASALSGASTAHLPEAEPAAPPRRSAPTRHPLIPPVPPPRASTVEPPAGPAPMPETTTLPPTAEPPTLRPEPAATSTLYPRPSTPVEPPPVSALPRKAKGPSVLGLIWALVWGVFRAIWAIVAFLGRAFYRLPRWGKVAAVGLPVAAVVALTVGPLGSGESIGDLTARVRDWLPSRSHSQPNVQIAVEFDKAPLVGEVGKVFFVTWRGDISQGKIVRYLLWLDDEEKPYPLTAPRNRWSSDSLPRGRHRLTLVAESDRNQRSQPAVHAFEIR